MDGSFEQRERDASPFTIGKDSFDQSFILVDGISPQYARFVRSMAQPVTKRERTFVKWQESCRKDI